MTDIAQLQKDLSGAIISLMRNKRTVFFSMAAANLRHIISETISLKTVTGKVIALPVKTACTDYKSCVYDPTFFGDLTKAEQLFIVAHEVGHVLFKHDLRCGSRDRRIWAKAVDYELNPILINLGLSMPVVGLNDPAFHGMSAEAIYQELLKVEPIGQEDPDQHFIYVETNEVDKAQRELQADNLIIKAAIASEMSGGFSLEDLPESVQDIITKARKPKLNPLRVLGNYISQTFGFMGYNYAKNHRKSSDTMYIPARSKKNVKHVMCFLDSSGSVTEENFAMYRKAIELTCERLKPQKITVIVFDRRLRKEYVLKSPRELSTIELVGRGGTSVFPVVERIQKDQPDLALVFTDGDFRIPEDIQLKRTVWYINDYHGFKMPKNLGVTINYDTPSQ